MTTLWTIGHSTRTLDELVAALSSCRIEVLVDVRRFPGSRRHPHFATDPLKRGLFQAGIRYEFLGDELGGFRKTTPDSPHVGLRDSSFRGYADWTGSTLFGRGVARLEAVATTARACVMCAERLPASCHRRILSDYLAVARGYEVMHVLDPGATRPHASAPGLVRAADGILYRGAERPLA